MPQSKKVSVTSLQQRALDTATYMLLRLPRELRDLIYSYICESPDSQPITLEHAHLSTFDPNLDNIYWLSSRWVGPLIASEIAECFYGFNAFAIPLSTRLNESLSFCRWGSGVMPSAFLRRLSIELLEDPNSDITSELYQEQVGDFRNEDQYYEQVFPPEKRRAQFACLLRIPRLEKLDLRIQKSYDAALELRDLNPIIHQLRQQHPKLKITLSVSFDRLLQQRWDSWNSIFGTDITRARARGGHLLHDDEDEDEFEPAGFSDCTELISQPSEEDRKYVEDFLSDGIMPQRRNAPVGLLNQDVQTRRMLQACYACQEPALMRVKLEEHWNFWQKWESSGKTI